MSQNPGPNPTEPPSTYPSYDEWLAARGLPTSTTPTPVGISRVDPDYSKYIKKTELAKSFDPNRFRYHRGERYVYGTHQEGQDLLPIYGPAEWYNWYPSFYLLGNSSHAPFSNSSRFENILGNFGFLLGDNIAFGEEDQIYDNQVWKVSRYDEQAQDMVVYACKIVHVRNFTQLSLPEAGHQILKEAMVLLRANHQSIMKVLKNLFIEDTETDFPYLFIASIMPLMNGTVDGLIANSPNLILAEEQCLWCLKDCAQGINYLHNEIRSPGGEWMRVVHMAIRAANILYRTHNDRNRFKLADFEECIVYDRHFRPDIWDSADPQSFPPDVMPDPKQVPYALSVSAPEIREAQKVWVDRTNLRLMPNDIYCLAMTIIYSRVDNNSNVSTVERIRGMLEMLENYQPGLKDVPLPPNSLEHLISGAVHPDPNQRVTVTAILEHPFLNTQH